MYKPVALEAGAAADTIIAILKGELPTADKKLADGTRFIAVTPIKLGPEKVTDVVTAGDAKASDICTAALAEACAKYGVK